MTLYWREIEAGCRGSSAWSRLPVDLRSEQDVDAGVHRRRAAQDRRRCSSSASRSCFGSASGSRKLALERRLPVISPILEMAHVGALMAYGSRLVDDVARVPYYLDRILKGTRPQELPVEQPSRFYLVINRAAARGLGIVVPPGVLARADETVG